MAGVKPVEYIKDSSTAGFAVAGDQKPITDNNANTIKKDVDQGNTQKLDNGQTKLLDSKVDEDTIDYSNDEMKNVGKNQIDTKGKDGEELSEKDDKAGAAVSTTVAAAGTAWGAAGAIYAAVTSAQKGAKIGEHFPGGMLPAGIVAAASSVTSLVFSFENVFDPNISERENQTSAAESNDETIDNYIKLMTSDMDTMVEDAEKYKDLSDSKLASDIERMTQIGVLQGQIASLQEQGNLEKVAELQAQLDELTQEGEEDPTGAMLGDLEKGLETYSGNSAEASGVAESGSTVSEFLKDGHAMKGWATAAEIASYMGAGIMIICTAIAAKRVGKDLSGILTAAFASVDTAGMALFAYSAIVLGIAGAKYGKIASKEGDAADAGDKMQEYVNNLHSNVEQQTGFTETTGAGYTAITTENAETTKKVQDGINKANKNNPTQPTGNNPTTPTNGNGNGDGNGNGEKPKETPVPGGAAA